MSVWKKFQRVGKKASKFQFTASYSELKLETNNFQPDNIVISWNHRNRKYSSKLIKLIAISSSSQNYSYVWEVPENIEIVTTLYQQKKDTGFEEKDWTFQIDDVRDDGSRRRVLAYRNINIAQYADRFHTQNNIKVNFKLSSKKLKSAALFLTLSSVFLKEGEATDDDMISVASLMSIPSNSNFGNTISNSDIGQLSDLDEFNNSILTSNEELEEKDDKLKQDNLQFQITELCDQIGQLDMVGSIIEEDESDENTPKGNFKLNEENICEIPESIITRKSRSPPNNLPISRYAESEFIDPSEVRKSIIDNDSTLDLMNWCKEVTKTYKNVSITNFTTSFRNGLAFCDIIHHYRPDLIKNITKLNPANVKENNSLAFNIGFDLGIPKVMDANEMAILKIPDPLSVMTYLHQLRTHFTGGEIVLTPASIGHHSPGNYQKKSLSPIHSPEVSVDIHSNTQFPEFFDQSSKEMNQIPSISTNLIVSDVEKSNSSNPFNVECNEVVTKTSEIVSNNEKTSKKSPKKQKIKLASFNVDGSIKEEKLLSEKKVKKISIGKLSKFAECEENKQISNNGKVNDSKLSLSKQQNLSRSSSSSPQKLPTIKIMEKNEIPQPKELKHNLYLSAEVYALEIEQEKIDEQANNLERELRAAMKTKDSNLQSSLLSKWFDLVNKKNALIRRNMQLQILEKEQDLERKWNLLQSELRQILSVEDWNKSAEMSHREELLMKDLIDIVNQRDSVVNELDKYEQGIAADIEFAKQHPEIIMANSHNLVSADFKDKNCKVM